MYTVDYLKTLHADYVEWNTDPGSMIMPKDTYHFDYASDDEIKILAEIEDEDEDDFADAIREKVVGMSFFSIKPFTSITFF